MNTSLTTIYMGSEREFSIMVLKEWRTKLMDKELESRQDKI